MDDDEYTLHIEGHALTSNPWIGSGGVTLWPVYKQIIDSLPGAYHLLDIGAGCGVLGIAAAVTNKCKTMSMIELDQTSYKMMEKNRNDVIPNFPGWISNADCWDAATGKAYEPWSKIDLIIGTLPMTPETAFVPEQDKNPLRWRSPQWVLQTKLFSKADINQACTKTFHAIVTDILLQQKSWLDELEVKPTTLDTICWDCGDPWVRPEATAFSSTGFVNSLPRLNFSPKERSVCVRVLKFDQD